MNETKIKKIATNVGLGIGCGALILYSLWWVATAVGVVGVITSLLNTVWGSFLRASGWRQLYLSGGVITLIIFLVRFGPAAAKQFLQVLAKDPMEAIIALVVFGCIPILTIPLIMVAWPFVWWSCWEGVLGKGKVAVSHDDESG